MDVEICPKGRAWMEISVENLAYNVEQLRKLLPAGAKLMPALKANAYGHGAGITGRALNEVGVDSFCVASVEEGVELRDEGVKGDILILGYTSPENFRLLKSCELTQSILDYDYAKIMNSWREPLKCHLAVDTGMKRIGENWENFDRILEIFRMDNLDVSGIFTHLCVSDGKTPSEREFTYSQGKKFNAVVKKLNALGYEPKTHLLGSYGLLNYPQLGGDFVRTGIAMYGVLSRSNDLNLSGVQLRPVMELKSKVTAVKKLEAGEGAGYGLDYRAEKPSVLAILSIGYGDGLPRELSNGAGEVLINGTKAPIAGRICMDQCLVDVSDIEAVHCGDTAVIIGKSGNMEIRAEELAEQAGTISNELLSRMGSRLHRIRV